MIRKIVCATSLIFCAHSGLAYAGDAATAEALFREGRTLMDAGNYAAACPKLEESYAQDPATGTLLALGICQERAGQTASAWATYSEAAGRAKRDGRADREKAAREHMAALEPKLSHLTISVDPSAASVGGFSVKRDGHEIGAGAWGTRVPIDPGEHTIEASAPGHRPFSAKISITTPASAQTVQIPPLALEPVTPSAGAVASAPSPESRADVPAPRPAAPLRVPGLIVGGVGLVTLGVSGVFALRAGSLNRDSKADGHCDARNQCDDVGASKRDDAKTAANIATVTVLAGGALTALGVTLFLLKPRTEPTRAAQLQALPLLGQGQAGMLVQGRF